MFCSGLSIASIIFPNFAKLDKPPPEAFSTEKQCGGFPRFTNHLCENLMPACTLTKKEDTKMFGKKMEIQIECGVVKLKPFVKEEISDKHVIEMLSDHEVTRYLHMNTSPTKQDEEEWFENSRTDRRTFLWGIYLDDSQLLGTTSLKVDEARHVGYTGFMIFNKKYWRRGIASASHIARTFYAVNCLDIKTIISSVFSPNTGSLKALQSVGYFEIGTNLGICYIEGVYRNMIALQWINPKYKEMILSDNVPNEFDQRIKNALEIARKTLEKAEANVKF